MLPPHPETLPMYNIIESVDRSVFDKQLSVSERYYERKYCKSIEGVDSLVDQAISFHSNRVCLLSLGENHPIIKNSLTIKKVNFDIEGKIDRSKNSAVGKGKRGAQKLTCDSIICYLETDDGTYPVYSCIKGKLIEVNEKLTENPTLLIEKPFGEGYIALLLPVLSLYDACKSSMLSRDAYLNITEVDKA